MMCFLPVTGHTTFCSVPAAQRHDNRQVVELLQEVELLPMLSGASRAMAGQMVMQTGFNLWLSSLFLTRGEYFKAQILRLLFRAASMACQMP